MSRPARGLGVRAGEPGIKFWLSSPSAILSTLWGWMVDGSLWAHLGATLSVMVIGYVIGCAVGIGLGLLFGFLPRLYRVLVPFVAAFYALPKIALAPLFIILLGIGMSSKVALVAITVFFLLLNSTIDGVRDVDRDLVQSLRLMGATRIEVLRKVLLPSALPWIFTGMPHFCALCLYCDAAGGADRRQPRARLPDRVQLRQLQRHRILCRHRRAGGLQRYADGNPHAAPDTCRRTSPLMLSLTRNLVSTFGFLSATVSKIGQTRRFPLLGSALTSFDTVARYLLDLANENQFAVVPAPATISDFQTALSRGAGSPSPAASSGKRQSRTHRPAESKCVPEPTWTNASAVRLLHAPDSRLSASIRRARLEYRYVRRRTQNGRAD